MADIVEYDDTNAGLSTDSGSQDERIGILKMALSLKGVSSDSGHYVTAPGNSSTETTHQDFTLHGRALTTPRMSDADRGIDL